MTRFFCLIACMVMLMALPPRSASAWQGTVVKVIDGDSIKVRRGKRLVEVRLYGIDTPEYRQPYSNKAKQLTRRLVNGKQVEVEEMDIDRYSRVVAVVTSSEKMVNRELVRAGLAWYYPRYCHAQPLCGELLILEQHARERGVGLWRDKDPVAPWDWKRRQRESGSATETVWHERFLHWWQRFIP